MCIRVNGFQTWLTLTLALAHSVSPSCPEKPPGPGCVGKQPQHTGRPPGSRGEEARASGRRGEERKGRTLPRRWATADHTQGLCSDPPSVQTLPSSGGGTIPGSLALPPRDLCENPPPLGGGAQASGGAAFGLRQNQKQQKNEFQAAFCCSLLGAAPDPPCRGAPGGGVSPPTPPRSLAWASISSRACPPLGGVGRAAWAVLATAEVLGVSRPMVRQGQASGPASRVQGSRPSALLLSVLRPFPAKTLHLLS